VRETGTGAASAAISLLGLDLDLIEHKVLVRMRGGARCRTVALCTNGQSQRWDERAREERSYKAERATAVIATTTG
jgi:hypothetical protein